ncbi:A/G-specific adenine glycosylase [Celeribacter arenosi]|uniref:Adenine DNA glycosylase n=2 Tax=Celeribacter arenosi TaxID=792649 RepID=A0ABP7JYM6_9RHOB
MKQNDMASALLDWYDRHARTLPWRVSPADRLAGVRPDPYRVWLSEIMLQQTTVTTVKPYFERFLSIWPTVNDLAGAQDDAVFAEWAGLGYYARARNLVKCARVVARDHGGVFPVTSKALLDLPGIGPYTAAAVGAIAFDEPATVLDGNVERVMSRLFRVEMPLPASKESLRKHASDLTPQARAGDYAQAVMDLGATICTPRSPACGICPWSAPCLARAAGDADSYPRKTPKKPKPVRRGHVSVAQTEMGEWVLEKRPEKGLLGGMLGWPGSGWAEGEPDAPEQAGVRVGQVTHTFTHFHLVLDVHVKKNAKPPADARLVAKHDFRRSDIPTVMRKAFDLARASFDTEEKVQ